MSDDIRLLIDAICSSITRGNFNFDRIVQHGVSKLLNFLGIGGREKQVLTLGRHQLQNLLNVIDKPHVQHAVSFVKDQNLYARELHLTSLTEVEQASWSGNDNIESTTECINLRLKTYATENHKRANIYMLTVINDALMHLCSKLSSRREYQCPRALILAIKLRSGKNLQHG